MLKCVLSPIVRPLKSVARGFRSPQKTRSNFTASDSFERGKAVKKPAKVRQLYSISDPFTREAEYVETKPVRNLDAIFQEGWARLAVANTVEAKRQALNGIIFGVALNSHSDCICISRAIVERLRTGKQVQMKDYAHLKQTLTHTWDANEAEMGIFSARPDRVAKLPESEWHNASEAEVFNRIDGYYSTLRAQAKKEFEALKKSFVRDYSINQQGVQKARCVQDIESAMRKAGDGAIGYIYPDAHVLPVVNVKGDIFALPNSVDTRSCAEHLSGDVINILGVDSPQHLSYAITKHKLHRPGSSSSI